MKPMFHPCLLLLLLGQASAQLVHEPFDGSGDLVGSSGGIGFSGAWTDSGDTAGSATFSPFANNYSDGSNNLSSSGSAAFLDGNIGPLIRSASHAFSNGETAWIAIRGRWEGTDRQQSGFEFQFTGSNLLLDFNAGATNDDNSGIIRLGSASTAPLSPITNSDFFFVLRIDFNAGAETLTLWRDPSLTGEPDPTDALLTTSLELGSAFTGLSMNSDGAITALRADEFRLATSFPEAAPKDIPEPVVVDSFTSNPSLIASGQESSLQWQTSNATNITISSVPGSQPSNGVVSVSPAITTTYMLTAGNSLGDESAQTTVTVVTLEFSSDKDVIDGSPTTLSWNAPGATGVTISTIGVVATSGTLEVNPTETTTYTIEASYPEGTVSRAVTISQPADAPPNFLFIAIDDLKPINGYMADNPGNFLNFLYPDPKVRAQVVANLTPNIDRLAETGIPFHRAYCSNAVCRPSRTALMSGFRPYTSNITGNADEDIRDSNNPLVANSITLSQNLKNNGYFTAGCGKIWHNPTDQAADKANSWTAWIDPVPDYLSATKGSNTLSEWSPVFSVNPNSVMRWGTDSGPTEGQGDYNNAEFIARLIEQGAINADGQSLDITKSPWFLACGIFRPHLPFNCPQELADLFDIDDMVADQATLAYFLADDNASASDGDMADILEQGRARAAANGLTNDEGEIRAYKECVRHYLGSVALADRCVGRLLDALDASPYADNTVVVLWSDHGWFLGEKNRWRKTTQWDEAANCVLVVRDPRPGQQAAPGTPCFRTVNLQDLYPTIMSLADVPLPSSHAVAGYDITPLLTNPQRAWNIPALTTGGTNDHGLRFGEWSYIRDNDDVSSAKLFHLPSDPDERSDLAGDPQFASVKSELDALLNRMVAGDPFPERNDDSFANWRLGFSSWPQDGDETDRNTDPNQNGVDNFGEYLRFSDPFATGLTVPLLGFGEGPELSLRFPIRSTDQNLIYKVEKSETLESTPWPSIWNSSVDSFPIGATSIELPVSSSGPRKFWRLDVEDASAP